MDNEFCYIIVIILILVYIFIRINSLDSSRDKQGNDSINKTPPSINTPTQSSGRQDTLTRQSTIRSNPTVPRSYPSSSAPINPTQYTSPSTSTKPNNLRSTPSSYQRIKFKDISTKEIITAPKLEDLQDALTGEKLNVNRKLFQCNKCKVFYHSDSYLILKNVNDSRCVACQSTDITPVKSPSKTSSSSSFIPQVVTLETYRQNIGHVVTFEGYVYKVLESNKSPDNFAVMFENKSWVRGFKLVFLKNVLKEVGGEKYIWGLVGKPVRVRG